MLLEREAFLDVLAGPPGRLILVGGEAGVGKTALVRAFAEGRRVLWGACDPLHTPRPLGPLLDIADAVGGELQSRPSGAAARAARHALLHALRETPGTVLVLEDVHWADEGTLDVLRLLGRRMEGVPALAVATFRDDEPAPLRIVLGELATAAGVERIKLPPLSPEAVRALAEPHGIDAADLHRSTGGNPFYVTEVLSAPAAAIPATVRDAVLARAARLSPPARELLERLAMIPGAADPELIDAADEPLDECLLSGMTRLDGARRRVPPRAGAARARGGGPAAPPRGAAPRRARAARRARRRPGPARPPRRGRRRRRRGPAPRPGRGRAGGAARRAPRGGRAVRARPALGRRARRSRERAELLERRSYECYLTDQIDGGDRGARAGARLPPRARRRHRARATPGAGSRACTGSTAATREAERFAAEAVDQLERLPPGPELAMAFSNRAQLAMLARTTVGRRATGAAARSRSPSRSASEEIVMHALNNVGVRGVRGRASPAGRQKLERSLAMAQAAGYAGARGARATAT